MRRDVPAGECQRDVHQAWSLLQAASRNELGARTAAFDLILAQIPHVPGIPAPVDDWAQRSTAFLDEYRQARIGQFRVTIINPINGVGRTDRVAADGKELGEIIASLRGADTRVTVERIIGWLGGRDLTAPVDRWSALIPAAKPAPAGVAFPLRPGAGSADAVATCAPALKPRMQRPTRSGR